MLHLDVLMSILLQGLAGGAICWSLLSFYFSAPYVRDWVDERRVGDGVLNEGLSCWHCLSFHVCLFVNVVLTLVLFRGGVGLAILFALASWLVAVAVTHILNQVCEIDPSPEAPSTSSRVELNFDNLDSGEKSDPTDPPEFPAGSAGY